MSLLHCSRAFWGHCLWLHPLLAAHSILVCPLQWPVAHKLRPTSSVVCMPVPSACSFRPPPFFFNVGVGYRTQGLMLACKYFTQGAGATPPASVAPFKVALPLQSLQKNWEKNFSLLPAHPGGWHPALPLPPVAGLSGRTMGRTWCLYRPRGKPPVPLIGRYQLFPGYSSFLSPCPWNSPSET